MGSRLHTRRGLAPTWPHWPWLPVPDMESTVSVRYSMATSHEDERGQTWTTLGGSGHKAPVNESREAPGIAMGAAALLIIGFCGGWLVGIHADDEAPVCHSVTEDSVIRDCDYRN